MSAPSVLLYVAIDLLLRAMLGVVPGTTAISEKPKARGTDAPYFRTGCAVQQDLARTLAIPLH
jgi:hypothetical protein